MNKKNKYFKEFGERLLELGVELTIKVMVPLIFIIFIILFVIVTKPIWVLLYTNGLGGIWTAIVGISKSIWCGASGCN